VPATVISFGHKPKSVNLKATVRHKRMGRPHEKKPGDLPNARLQFNASGKKQIETLSNPEYSFIFFLGSF